MRGEVEIKVLSEKWRDKIVGPKLHNVSSKTHNNFVTPLSRVCHAICHAICHDVCHARLRTHGRARFHAPSRSMCPAYVRKSSRAAHPSSGVAFAISAHALPRAHTEPFELPHRKNQKTSGIGINFPMTGNRYMPLARPRAWWSLWEFQAMSRLPY